MNRQEEELLAFQRRRADAWKERAMYEVAERRLLERDLQELMFKHAIPLYHEPEQEGTYTPEPDDGV